NPIATAMPPSASEDGSGTAVPLNSVRSVSVSVLTVLPCVPPNVYTRETAGEDGPTPPRNGMFPPTVLAEVILRSTSKFPCDGLKVNGVVENTRSNVPLTAVYAIVPENTVVKSAPLLAAKSVAGASTEALVVDRPSETSTVPDVPEPPLAGVVI